MAGYKPETAFSGARSGSYGGEADRCRNRSWTEESEGLQVAFGWSSGFALGRVPSVIPGGLGRATSIEPAPHSQGKIVLAVLPFENLSRDPDQEFFSDGLTEEMIAQVGKLNRIE